MAVALASLNVVVVGVSVVVVFPVVVVVLGASVVVVGASVVVVPGEPLASVEALTLATGAEDALSKSTPLVGVLTLILAIRKPCGKSAIVWYDWSGISFFLFVFSVFFGSSQLKLTVDKGAVTATRTAVCW